jgi:hypothetical protein
MNLCSYYQAYVVSRKCWFFVGILRSFEHLCFDRTLDVEKSIFEFFVPPGLEQPFEELMDYFQHNAIIKDLKKLPNRFG